MNEIDQEILQERRRLIEKLTQDGEHKLAKREKEIDFEKSLYQMEREKLRMDLIDRVRRYIPEPFKDYLECVEANAFGASEVLLNQFFLKIPGYMPIGLKFIQTQDSGRTYLVRFMPFNRRKNDFDRSVALTDVGIALAVSKRQADEIEAEKVKANEPVYVSADAILGELMQETINAFYHELGKLLRSQHA